MLTKYHKTEHQRMLPNNHSQYTNLNSIKNKVEYTWV